MSVVLIVDDEPVNRLLLATVLKTCGHEMLEAESGEAALELARERRPDLIILDLHLPGMPGTQFMKSLRADPAIAQSKVALYTASRVDAAMRGFMELARIDHVIEKPSEPESILRVVALALQ